MRSQSVAEAGQHSSRRVAIVVPGRARSELHAEELISLRHLRYYLGRYDTYLVVPEGSEQQYPGLTRMEFSPDYFGSLKAHNRLMLSKEFYSRFRAYEFILIYHTDALVLSDQLEEWCDAGYDYIGGPLFRRPNGEPPDMARARNGNGGFSLRRVAAHLRVLESRVPMVDVRREWHQRWAGPRAELPLGLLKTTAKLIPWLNDLRWEARRHTSTEDYFWSDRAAHYAPFNKAPLEASLRFAFNRHPRYCLEQAKGRLPFGVHAWHRHDRALWEPYLLPETATATLEAGMRLA